MVSNTIHVDGTEENPNSLDGLQKILHVIRQSFVIFNPTTGLAAVKAAFVVTQIILQICSHDSLNVASLLTLFDITLIHKALIKQSKLRCGTVILSLCVTVRNG